jgi:hypothetical protein
MKVFEEKSIFIQKTISAKTGLSPLFSLGHLVIVDKLLFLRR